MRRERGIREGPLVGTGFSAAWRAVVCWGGSWVRSWEAEMVGGREAGEVSGIVAIVEVNAG